MSPGGGMKSGLLISAVLLLVLICGCNDKKTIKIGYIGGLTGRNGDLGTAGRDGALLAIEAVNASGGIGGRSLELIIRDDKSDPVEAARVVKELVDDKVMAVVGPMTSAMASATIPVIDAAQTVMLAPTVSGSGVDFTGRDDYFIRLNLNSDTAAATAERMVKKLGIKSVAIVYDMANKSYSASLVAAFKARLVSLGGNVVADQPFSSKEKPDLMMLAKSAADKKAQGILIVGGALDSAMLCQQLKKLGSTVPIFISEWGGTNEFLKAGGSAAAGVYIYQHFNSDSASPDFAAFKNDYTKRFGDPPSFAATYSHEAVSILATALKKDVNPSHLKDTITAIGQFKGLQGNIAIDRFGDPLRSFFLMQVRDGRFAVME